MRKTARVFDLELARRRARQRQIHRQFDRWLYVAVAMIASMGAVGFACFLFYVMLSSSR